VPGTWHADDCTENQTGYDYVMTLSSHDEVSRDESRRTEPPRPKRRLRDAHTQQHMQRHTMPASNNARTLQEAVLRRSRADGAIIRLWADARTPFEDALRGRTNRSWGMHMSEHLDCDRRGRGGGTTLGDSTARDPRVEPRDSYGTVESGRARGGRDSALALSSYREYNVYKV